MKKLILLLLALFLLSSGNLAAETYSAEPLVGHLEIEEVNAYFNVGKLELIIPIKNNLQLVSLYDIWNGEGLLGGETIIAQYDKLNLNFGAVSSFTGQGTPYLSMDYDFSKTLPEMAIIGLWCGYDFHLKEYRAGLKASISFRFKGKYFFMVKGEVI